MHHNFTVVNSFDLDIKVTHLKASDFLGNIHLIHSYRFEFESNDMHKQSEFIQIARPVCDILAKYS